ncbi:MAG: hypothetical protein JW782_06545 [Candidatus Saganbacteria bacterium]|nr:hypothetical protein [Candidatus Saganbacteria bacterium]
MSIVGSLNSGQIGGSRESMGSGSLGSLDDSSALLARLEDQVNSALGFKDEVAGIAGAETVNPVNPQEVVSYMADLSDQHQQGPIAGMQLSNVV